MSWNYRIVRSKRIDPDGDYFSLREVYYNEAGKPYMVTKREVGFICGVDEGPEGIVKSLKRALSDAKQHPVLNEEDIP